MRETAAIWDFTGMINDSSDLKVYPGVKRDLWVLLTNIISAGILFPTKINDETLVYETADQLLELISNSGRLNKPTGFNLYGDTRIYTRTGVEIYHDIVRIEGFTTYAQEFMISFETDIWMPMVYDQDKCEFIWNLEYYNLNYERVPTLLKTLHQELNWENKSLLYPNGWYTTMQTGYDFFVMDDIIAREYEENPNPDFNLEAYLNKIKTTRALYKDKYGE
ncbi:hypothetical protein [Chitinophaga sp. Cy-1792]|uniref:hypothetical protein n=1 Tax=Chitinophaga sp. Cy-1792 TaxID=2608339 RepID=UPI00141E862F|nr:hypothetical protein [Chitinophaga sp. Cy-1792]NIG55057.1 hypothetical protein [Chitinophaga sp. Cy-1792]